MKNQNKEEIIRALEPQYRAQMISVRSVCELVFYILEHYDPDLHLRVLEKLLGDRDGRTTKPDE